MHHIYHTEGLILGSQDFGEAGKRYVVLTRDLGLIHARATGVRKMSSKLRYVLQDFACVKIDLVQGKNFWRVTSASKTDKLQNIAKKHKALEIFARISGLLSRLLAAAEPDEKLFTDFLHGLSILEKAETKEDLRNIEAIIVLRALHTLGYIGGDEILENLVESPFGAELLFKVAKSRAMVLSQINKALRESQL